MKKLLFLLLAAIPFFSSAQPSESHDFIRYDSVFTDGCGPWHLWIWRPRHLFTAGSADTASRPLIIEMPGQGEQNTADTNKMDPYGFIHQLKNGWDGSVVLGNGIHYPTIIVVVSSNTVTPYPPCVVDILGYLKTTYKAKAGCTYWTGYSQGAFSGGSVITFEQTAGAETGMKLLNALAALEGTPDPLPSPYSTWNRDTVAYKVWAAKYHGKYFYLEGSGSDNFRDGWHYSRAMNDSVPNSAYFSYENAGGGAHCCWDVMWNVNNVLWSSVAPLGTFNSGSQAGTNTIGTYKSPSSVIQWMLRQGDTSLVGTGIGILSCNAGNPQTISLPTSSVTLTGSAIPPIGEIVTSYHWTKSSGPGSPNIGSPTSASTSVTSLSQGTYTFTLGVKDSGGDSTTSSVNITVLSSSCRIINWDITNGSIKIDNATLGLTGNPLHRCDEVDIPNKPGGYRTFTLSNVGSQTDSSSGMIVVRFKNGAFITPSTSNIFGNSIDNCNWIQIDSLVMQDHADPTMFSLAATNHSHHIYWTNGSSRGCTFLPSGSASYDTTKVKNFITGTADTVHCFYDWKWLNWNFDSIQNNATSGLTALWLGTLVPNQLWFNVEIAGCHFGDYPSFTIPANYIHALNVQYLYVHNDSMWNLGGGAPRPTGHAAQIFSQGGSFRIENNWFGPDNFGDEVRSFGTGEITAFRPIMATIDPNFHGVSSFSNNIIFRKRKYPVIEVRRDDVDTIAIPYYYPRTEPYITGNTADSLAIGIGNQDYEATIVDWYGSNGPKDTMYVHNNIYTCVRDTTAAAWGFQSSTAGIGLISSPNGKALAANTDTANNIATPFFSQSGLVDNIQFYPIINGLAYHSGIAFNPFRPTDIYGNARAITGPVSRGAVELGQSIIPTGNGQFFYYHRRRSALEP